MVLYSTHPGHSSSGSGGSSSAFGTTSPPPQMYDTSTSTAESTRTSSKTSKGYSNTASAAARSKLKAKSKATQYAASASSIVAGSSSVDTSQHQHQQQSPSTPSSRRAGSFRSQAALLVGTHASPATSTPRSSSTSSPSRRQSSSPSRILARRNLINRSRMAAGYHQQETASEVSAPAAFSSAAASYIQQHQQQSSPARSRPLQINPPQTPQGGYRSDISAGSRLKDGLSVTELSSIAAHTVTTQSEPGGTSFSHHSYYTLSDHYSSSATPSTTPDHNRKFAPRVNTSLEEQSQQPLIPPSRDAYAAASSRYPTTSNNNNNASLTTPTKANRNPFTSQQPRTPGSNSTPMSVSQRIRLLSQNNHLYPDPEPAVEDESSSHQEGPPQPSRSVYSSEGRKENTPQSGDKRYSVHQLQQDMRERYEKSTTTPISSAGRNSAGGQQPSTTRSSSPSTPNHNESQQHHHHYVPASVRRGPTNNNNEPITSDTEGGVDESRHSTSLPPVRRRKPLQQPAYNSQQPERQEQPQEDTPVVTNPPQHRHSMPDSPSRVQEMKRRLWSEDEKLNLSLDHSASESHREGRSLSPRQHRHSTGGVVRNMPATTTAASSTNSNVGGFKSKFFQAAMAAHRNNTPPRPRPEFAQQQPPPGAAPTNPGTPPRPRSASSSLNISSQRLNSSSAAPSRPDYPTPQPRPSQQEPEPAVTPVAPNEYQQTHSRVNSISPQRSRQIPIQERAPPMNHQVSQKQQPQLEQPQHQQSSLQQSYPPPPFQDASPQEGQDYIAKLMAKLSAVRRDDPHAALAQIDSILRAESRSNGSGDPIQRIGANVEGMPLQYQRLPPQPADSPPQQYPLHQHQAFSGQQPVPHQHQTQFQYQQMEGPAMPENPGQGHDDLEDSSDDATSVSSITNPTYRSAMPTHEQIHDMPPPTGISTSLYRRPRPNGLQGYSAPTPPVSGLELVQRHHQRQAARKGYRNGEDQQGHVNHPTSHLPPMTINVASDSGSNVNATRAFTENLLKSSNKKVHQDKLKSATELQAESTGTSRLKVEDHPHDEMATPCAAEPQNLEPPQERKQPNSNAVPAQDKPTGPLEEEMLDFPSMEYSRTDSDKKSGNASHESKAKETTKSPMQSDDLKHGSGGNPFGGGDDVDMPRYAMESGGKERKLDQFIYRKKQQEHEQFLKTLEELGDTQHLTGDELARKIQAWDEMSAPNSKAGSSRSEVSGKHGPSSQKSTGGNSAGGEVNPANVSTATTSSAVSRHSKRSHPWNSGTRLKIDFRDTSMDNALGVEAECISQPSPARDLRRAARQQHQRQNQLVAEDTSGQVADPHDKKQDGEEASRSARQPNEVSQSSIAREHEQRASIEDEQKFVAALGPQQLFASHPKDVSTIEPPYLDHVQDKGFEVTPVYGSDLHPSDERMTHSYADNSWVAVPSNTFFSSAKSKPNPKVVATLVDEDTNPVTMVRSPPPELPNDVADAFADVPVPFDEPPKTHNPQHPRFGGDVLDVSGIQETPPPPVAKAPESTPSRGRRAFANFLKKRGKNARKTPSLTPTSKKTSLASAVDHPESDRNLGLSSDTRGRRSASKSPAPRNRTRSLDDSGSRIRNPTIAKKFSRLMRVYGNEPSASGNERSFF